MAEIKNNPANKIKLATRIKILVGALLITPLAVFVGIISGGFGHGGYVWARILFPCTFASWYCYNREGTKLLLILGIFQIPIYGLLLALPSKRYALKLVVISMIIVHSIAVLLCFCQFKVFL